MPTRTMLGPDFEDFTMTSENFRWLHACRWEAAHPATFLALRTNFTNSFGKAPTIVNEKIKGAALTSAQWLLVDEDDKVHAWAELQSFPSRHDKFGLLLWGQNPTERTASFDKLHVTRLVSFCFVVGKFAHMKIVGSDEGSQNLVESFDIGEVRRTHVLPARPWHPEQKSPLIELKTLAIAREEWAASPIADSANKTLKHVAARISRFEKAEAEVGSKKQKRRNIFARLFRPRLDD